MKTLEIDQAIRDFKRRQKMRRISFAVILLAVLSATIGILYDSMRRARIKAAEQRKEFQIKADEQRKEIERYQMRTDRTIDKAEILGGVTGAKQKLAIQKALELYETKPPIQFTWGGKSPSAGFDSSSFVAYVLSEAGVLHNPKAYWSERLKKELKPRPLDQRQPGDVLFYPGGTCMFYLGGKDKLSVGALPGGIATGDFDRYTQPEQIGQY